MTNLLSRKEFKEQVFARSKGLCVNPNCRDLAVDAHHILDRKLWSDGGYYIDNGAAVCSWCHLKCESGTITVEQIREYAGITSIILPDGFDHDTVYDKWGNVMAKYRKYPHTPHLPWSPGVHSDDTVISEEDLIELFSDDVVITEKMDGENTTLYRDHIHARSIDSKDHPSRAWVKKFWGEIKHEIPEGWRICGENVYAKHSIFYSKLPSYFLGFSIWDEYNYCFNWQETQEWFQMLGIKSVPVLWTGNFDHCVPSEYELITPALYRTVGHEMEGYVVRTKTYNFHYEDFDKNIAKYVRANHVQTSEHWLNEPMVKNELE